MTYRNEYDIDMPDGLTSEDIDNIGILAIQAQHNEERKVFGDVIIEKQHNHDTVRHILMMAERFKNTKK